MKYLLSCLLIWCPLLANTNISQQKPATIKILLKKESNGAIIEARGPYTVYNPENGKKISSGRREKRFYCYPHNEGIKWGENFLGIFQIHIEPTTPNTTFLIDGKQYRGAIHVYHVENKINIINEIDIESYIKLTLPNKITSPLKNNVLDALAIISRTDAYYTAMINSDAFWHLTASEVGYFGMGLALQNLPVNTAVDNTRYLIMVYKNQLFPTSWTEHCGGKTASYASIFRKNVSTPDGVISSFATNNRADFYWNFSINTQELAKVVKANRVTGIDLFIDHSSGKVYGTRFHDGSHTEDINFIDLQKALGKDKLKSNDFTVNIKGNLAIFEGYGKGISTGLCLFSAQQMEDKGDSVPRMLETFFPDIQIEKMREYSEKITKTSFISQKNKKKHKAKHKLLHR